MKTILIVDPESEIGGTGPFLRRQGFLNVGTSDARSALTLMQNGMPVDLLITEMRLPDMDGLDFLSALHRLMPELPVIVATSLVSIESYLKAVSLGVVEYLNKPVLPRELSRIVHFALNRPAPAVEPPGGQGRAEDRA